MNRHLLTSFCLACALPLTAAGFGMFVEHDQRTLRVAGQLGIYQSIQYSTSLPAPVITTFIGLGDVALRAPWITNVIDNRKTTMLRSLWGTTNYHTNSLPSRWVPRTFPPVASDLSAFENFTPSPYDLSVANFIAQFGLPTRYLVANWQTNQVLKDHGGIPVAEKTSPEEVPDFLIYDLPSGHSVALYVRKPPNTSFIAAIIIDAKGQLVHWIR